MDRLARVLLLGRDAREHLLLVGLHEGAPHGCGERQRADLVAGGTLENRVADGVDLGRSWQLNATGQ